eukprot:GGOE01001513.1.p1 GENE.GGOE01001513.1~~GGOE01001513.1.p1  ORF type:complete len:509 (-),score=51.70 GGOE01001513.1:366-1769(-)
MTQGSWPAGEVAAFDKDLWEEPVHRHPVAAEESEAPPRPSMGHRPQSKRPSRAVPCRPHRFEYVWSLWYELYSDLEHDTREGRDAPHLASSSAKPAPGVFRHSSNSAPVPCQPLTQAAAAKPCNMVSSEAPPIAILPPPSSSLPRQPTANVSPGTQPSGTDSCPKISSAEEHQLNIQLLADELLAEVSPQPSSDDLRDAASDVLDKRAFPPPSHAMAALRLDDPTAEGLAFGPFEIPEVLPVLSLEEFLAHLTGKYSNVQQLLGAHGDPLGHPRKPFTCHGSQGPAGRPSKERARWAPEEPRRLAIPTQQRRPVSAPLETTLKTCSAHRWPVATDLPVMNGDGAMAFLQLSDASAGATTVQRRPLTRPMTADACLEGPPAGLWRRSAKPRWNPDTRFEPLPDPPPRPVGRVPQGTQARRTTPRKARLQEALQHVDRAAGLPNPAEIQSTDPSLQQLRGAPRSESVER